MNVAFLDIAAVGGAGIVAGGINAMAGGGTLIAFPSLVALGVPTVAANVTVTVGQTPGYLAGAWSQRADLANQLRATRQLSVFGGVGAVAGALLLEVTPNGVFKVVVPFLIVVSCAALVGQDRVRDWVRDRAASALPAPAPGTADAGSARPSLTLSLVIAAGGVYGGFFGAGLGIMMLAVLGLFSDEGVVRNNAVKQVLAFVINLAAAAAFALGHHVRWALVPSLAVGAIVGGVLGGRAVRHVNPRLLRGFVVVFGLAVAIDFWVG